MNSLNLSLEEIQESYLKKEFLSKLYNYYINGGFYNIILTELINILTSSFLIFYTIFLYNCIEWNKIFKISEKTTLQELIHINTYFKLDVFFWAMFIIFVFIILCKILNLVNSFIEYKKISLFYNEKLQINDNELNVITWKEVIYKLKNNYTNNNDINIYYINNKICCKDNYFITIIDKDILKIKYLTKMMEWNIIFCIINSIFDSDLKFNKKFLSQNKTYISNIKTKLQVISIINFVFMPIIIMYLLFYYLFKYGEKFYNNPKYIATRNWTLLSKWKLRNYNELYHECKNKYTESYNICNEYVNLFPNLILQTFSKFLIFIFSSVFVILIFISIINENVLIKLYITNTKQTLWFIGILGSLIAIFKSSIKDKQPYYPKEKMELLKDKINCIPDNWLENTHKINNNFFKYYQYQIVILLKDLFYSLTMPFKLYEISINTKNIIWYLNNITIDSEYGHLNIYSHFQNTNILNSNINNEQNNVLNDQKRIYSIETFEKNNNLEI